MSAVVFFWTENQTQFTFAAAFRAAVFFALTDFNVQ
jgi:hypothetical protein